VRHPHAAVAKSVPSVAVSASHVQQYYNQRKPRLLLYLCSQQLIALGAELTDVASLLGWLYGLLHHMASMQSLYRSSAH